MAAVHQFCWNWWDSLLICLSSFNVPVGTCTTALPSSNIFAIEKLQPRTWLQIPKRISTDICKQADAYIEGPPHYLTHLYFSMLCIATQPHRRQITETIPFLQSACLSCEVSLHDEVDTANNYNISWKWILTKEGWKPPQICKSVVPF
jgi:hypothetical protein